MTEVRYCYRCGRKVNPEHKDCWYCGVPLHRQLRAPRRCPYCDNEIRPNAIKCHHCGEFLDQSATATRDRRESGATFVIDKAVIQNVTDESGRTQQRLIGHEDRRRLEEPRKALEAPTAYRQPKPGQRRPPQPNDDAIQTAEFEIEDARTEPVTGRTQRSQPPAQPAPPTRPATDSSQKPAPTKMLPSVRARGGEKQLPAAPRRGGLKKAEPHETVPPNPALDQEYPQPRDIPADAPPEVRVTAGETTMFRVCGICGAEILKSDNFCYHCGQKYAREKFRFTATARGEGDKRLYAAIVALWLPFVFYFLIPAKSPAWLLILCAAAAFGLGAYSLYRWPRDPNRRNTLILLALTALLVPVPLIVAL